MHTFGADAPLRRMVILSSMLNFDLRRPCFCDKLVEWENRLREYERSLPVGREIGESIKIAMATQVAPRSFDYISR